MSWQDVDVNVGSGNSGCNWRSIALSSAITHPAQRWPLYSASGTCLRCTETAPQPGIPVTSCAMGRPLGSEPEGLARYHKLRPLQAWSYPIKPLLSLSQVGISCVEIFWQVLCSLEITLQIQSIRKSMGILKAKSKLYVMTNNFIFWFVLAFNSEVWGVTPSTRFPLFQVRIICSASAPLPSLFLHQPHDSELEQNRIMMDDLGLSQVADINIISLYYKTA